jgi:predicted metal-dependent hydrolase
MDTKQEIQSVGVPAGRIEYVRSVKARLLRISVRANGGVRVTVPRHGSLRQAEAFVRTKRAWIEKTLQRLAKAHVAGEAGAGRQRPVVTKEMLAQQHILFGRLKELAAQHGFRYGRAGIRNQKSRWGSCSTRNNISLNIHLLALPGHLRDYVILHELVHTEHKNHSKRFWTRLDELVGGSAKSLRKEMRGWTLQGSK